LRASKPLELSKNPDKARHGMSDVNCLVCGATLFINDSNPCNTCQYSWNDKRDNCLCCPLKESNQ